MRPQPDFSSRPRPARLALLDELLLGCAILVLLAVAGASWRLRAQADEAGQLLAAVRREVAEDAARARGLEPATAGGRQPSAASPARVVSALAAVLPPDVRVRQLGVDYTRRVALDIRLEARTPASWDRLLDALAASAEFTDVQPGPETRESPLAVTVEARWAGADR